LERNSKEALFLLLPFLAFVTAFMIYPLAYSGWLTFQSESLATLQPTFVGFSNWIALTKDPVFIQSTEQTIEYLVLEVAITVPVGLGLGLLLNEKFRGRTIIRASLLLPWATPPIVMAVMFTYIFADPYGVVNYALESLHITSGPVIFFADPHYALLMLVLVSSWKLIPLFAFIVLGALQTVPSEVIESAKVYKASSWSRFRKITFQYLKPTMTVNSILAAILSVQVFDVVIGITNGSPGYSTYMLYFYAYQQTFPFLNLGYGATVSYVVSIVAVLFAFGVLRIYKVD
jgi:multiple sugar transport system permease protein